MRIRLTVLGIELWCLEFSLIGDETEVEEDEEVAVLGGGSAHNFERDTTPLDPADHYGEWEWEDRKRPPFGF